MNTRAARTAARPESQESGEGASDRGNADAPAATAINLVSVRGRLLPEPLVFELGEGVTIGRAIDNTIVLYDPERHISRLHALIHRGDAGYVVRCFGRFVPLHINGVPQLIGEDVRLCVGDELAIGQYLLRVS